MPTNFENKHRFAQDLERLSNESLASRALKDIERSTPEFHSLKIIDDMNRLSFDSPAFKAIREMERNISESSALKAFKEMERNINESSAFKMIKEMELNFNESRAFKAIKEMERNITESSAIRAFKELELNIAESPALKALKDMQRNIAESPAARILNEMAQINSPAMKMLQGLSVSYKENAYLDKFASSVQNTFNTYKENFGEIAVSQAMNEARVACEAIFSEITPSDDSDTDQSVASSLSANEFNQLTIAIEELTSAVGFLSSTAHANNSNSKLTWIKIVFAFILLQIILPQLNSLVVNVYTPKLLELIKKKQEGKPIASVVRNGIPELSTYTNIRYISANRLRIRIGPSNRAPIIASVDQGTIVRVLEKSNHWIKIEFTANELKLQGWAYIRYVKRIK